MARRPAREPDRLSELSWTGEAPPPPPTPGLLRSCGGWARAAAATAATGALLAIYALFKLIERVVPAFGLRAEVQRLWARLVCLILGLRVRRVGRPMTQGGALVSNHTSWTDVPVLLTTARMTFVSKAEVRSWPGVGAIAALCDTMFIERRRTAARRQEAAIKARVAAGDRLLFFPEGTSTDGRRVVPFRSTLFAAFQSDELRDSVWLQPVSVIYKPNAKSGLPDVFYGWWGDMAFGAHVWSLLCFSRGGRATVVYHPPVRAADFPDRKALAAHCHREVEEGLLSRL